MNHPNKLKAFGRIAIVALALACSFHAPARAQDARTSLYNPSYSSGIAPIVAKEGLVVAQEKIAAGIGADILARGGNAVDAAVATGFAMAVTYPRAGNLGGGGFMAVSYTHLTLPTNREV